MVRCVAALVLLFGCTDGGTPDADARAYCDEQRTSNEGCFNDDTYDACVSCFLECGKACPTAESCPVQYPSCG